MPMIPSAEFKIKAIHRYENGESIRVLYKKLEISQSTLYHWRNQYCTIQTATHSYTPAEFDAITKYLKKCEALGAALQSVRIDAKKFFSKLQQRKIERRSAHK